MAETRETVLTRLLALWPILPFVGFGCCAAWFVLAEGTAWLSPVESTGAALTNLNAVVKIAMGAALLLSFAASLWGGERFRRVALSRVTAWVAGAVASAGSLLIILVGPAYLQIVLGPFSRPLFQLASVLIGIGLGGLFLQLGMRYSRLPLRRAMLYLCYAHLAAVFVYMGVRMSPRWTFAPDGPPLAVIAAFVALPLLCSASLSLNSLGNPQITAVSPSGAQGAGRGGCTSIERGMGRLVGRGVHSIKAQIGAYALFAGVLFVVALVQAAVCANVTNSADPAVTLGSYGLTTLLRVPLLLVFSLFAAGLEARRFNLSKFAICMVVLLELLVVLTLVMNTRVGEWVACVGCTAFTFELLAWFLLIAVAGSHPEHDTAVIALLYGAYALGTGMGALAGVAVPGMVGDPVFHVMCAALLLPSFLALGEKNVDRLFARSRGGSSFEEALGGRLRGTTARGKGDFSRKLDAFAERSGLSAREAEALHYLVAGRGDNQIAEAMGISYNTARTHVRNVYAKLGVHDRQKLIDDINRALR